MAKKQTQQFGDDLMPSELEKDLKKYESTNFGNLLSQIETEYKLSWYFMKPKLDEWALRLKLYNNQKRDKEAMGDPTLFTIHQTVLASLYNDKLGVTFVGREDGDDDMAENQNNLAIFDHEDMEKDVADYEWDFDASFFGRGLNIFMDFDRDTLTPLPEIVDMMTWLRDPRAKSVNGDRRLRGRMRWGGREIRLSKQEMRDSGIYFDFRYLRPDSTDVHSLLDNYSEARAEAQGLGNMRNIDDLEGDNADCRVLEWFTSWKGKLCLVGVANNFKKVVRFTPLEGRRWPIIDRVLYPTSHNWDGVSVPDLVEDKQRGKAAIKNLGLRGVKAGLNPMYVYDSNKIKNRNDLNFAFNKHIGVAGNPANSILPVQREVIKAEVGWILNELDNDAQKATATPEMQQGMMSDEKRTATEMNAINQNVSVRYSLSARIWGWSEKRFWQQWAHLYRENFDEKIDEKKIRISGVLGSTYRTLRKSDFVGETDPDIIIESKVVADALKTQQLNQFRLAVGDATKFDPNFPIRIALKEIFRLSTVPNTMIERLFPPTIDELVAQEENEFLNRNERRDVNPADDDGTHLEIHNKAMDTPYKIAHMHAHKKAMYLKKLNPQAFPQPVRPQMSEAQVKPIAAGQAPAAPSATAQPVQ